MKQWAKHTGFTVVELLIVIVVIGILATLTIISYSGVRTQADQAAARDDASQAFRRVATYYTQNGSYPASLSAAGYNASGGATLDFRTYNYGYCVSSTRNGNTYHMSSDTGGATYGTCGQIKAEYFNNTSFSGTPVLTQYEDVINNAWGSASPVPGIVNADNFTARYTAYLVPPVTGTYTFYTNMDDAERVTVNGVVLGDYLATGPCCTTRAMPITADLVAGQAVPVMVELREGGGSAYIRLYWAYPGQTQIIVPASAYVRLP